MTDEHPPNVAETPDHDPRDDEASNAEAAADSSDFESDGQPMPDGGAEGDHSTEGTGTRFWLTNDLLALVLVVTFVGIIAATASTPVTLEPIPSEVIAAWLLFVGTAVAWAFGKDAVEAWRGGK